MSNSPGSSAELTALVQTLISTRQTILPRWLAAPGPTTEQIDEMFRCAAAAPDHGVVMPWRFVVVPQDKREALADVFALALQERDVLATPEQVARAREKAFRAPFLALAIARLGQCEPSIEPLERMVSVGAAIQNILLCAHSMGFGGSLTSGQAMRCGAMRHLLGLAPGEQAICSINVGTALKRKPGRLHPDLGAFVSQLVWPNVGEKDRSCVKD